MFKLFITLLNNLFISFLNLFSPLLNNLFISLLNLFISLRAPPHVKFRPRVKFLFLISTRVEKSWCHAWVSTGGKTNIFYFISPRGENIFAKICAIFCKNLLWKKTFRMQLQDYIKTTMLDFINKRSLILKLLKQFYWLQLIQTFWQPRFY